ncbi:acyl-CoA synthetase [Parafrankia sp. EUN1f]|uniref:acyl-CoA synthetase n=1 Tax=Parafrankia sp. EUN1f TaxID=102897 RepID=UPI0001C438DF|nr:acyl-CoA synthetase [Parafrankia sp. EUN1f]EFC86857.1 AMP-dependent synthetase and ligase [Parafrankia sp. EUN1f]
MQSSGYVADPSGYATYDPDRPAVIMARGRQVITYGALNERSARLARLLSDRGLVAGDVVALLAENHPRFMEVLWAAVRSGLYITAVNRYGTAEEIAYILRDSGACALVTTATLAAAAVPAVRDVPGCATRLMIDGVREGADGGGADGFEAYEAAIAAVPAESPARLVMGELMLYSSGTTGRPKGIKRPLQELDGSVPIVAKGARMCRSLAGMSERSVYLCPAPLYHAAPLGWVRGAHELGATVVIMEKFDAREMLEVIERERVTHLQAVPTMFVRLLKLPAEIRRRYDLSSLQRVLHAGAPCPVPVKQQIIDWFGPIVTEYYSGTEGAGMTVISSAEWLERPGSVGRASLGTIRVCGPDGAELPAGETGSIYFEREDTVFEYHNDQEKTLSARHPQHANWLSLGDLGYVDEDGYLYLTDRSSFTIISGGVNIYPAEIEACLTIHPDVEDVAVFGLPDPEMGEYVHAVVQPVAGVEPTPELAEQLRAHVRAHLAGPKVPRVVDFAAELPRLPTGKLYKVPLRQQYLDRLAAEPPAAAPAPAASPAVSPASTEDIQEDHEVEESGERA